MNNTFAPGANVKTNESYYERYGRTVYGVIVAPRTEIGEGNVIMRWLSQMGNIDDRLTCCMVIMSKQDIELD